MLLFLISICYTKHSTSTHATKLVINNVVINVFATFAAVALVAEVIACNEKFKLCWLLPYGINEVVYYERNCKQVDCFN